jgi:hypothetical protein
MSLRLALAVVGVAGCGAAPSVTPVPQVVAAPPPDPEHFSTERFEANLRALVAFGARTPGSEALAAARRWAEANAPEARAGATIALVAPLATRDVAGAALAEESSGAALVIEVARALAARGERVAVAFEADGIAPAAALADAEVAVFVRRGCGLPQHRDLLSHRVLRERLLRAARADPAGFEQSEAPHGALRGVGAKRVVAVDAPAAAGAECAPDPLGGALVHFVTDTTALLARGRSNSAPPLASHGP